MFTSHVFDTPGRSTAAVPRTLFDKVWDDHLVERETESAPAVLYVDLHLIHEVTSPQAFDELRRRGLRVRRPDRTLGTCDHSTPTRADAAGRPIYSDADAAAQVRRLADNCAEFGIVLHALGDADQGIVHVIGPELGATRPGRTIVCGDSHTSTHGAFGALAFGIGTSEVGHVLATQCVLQRRPRTCRIRVDGTLASGVTAKDLALGIIARIGVGGARGHVVEYAGEAVRALSIEERLTLCNMSIEAGARAGLVAPDDVTFEYLADRPLAPRGAAWDAAIEAWRRLPGDEDARFDVEHTIDARTLEPMVTYGTNPGMATAVSEAVPEVSAEPGWREALSYMGFEPGRPLLGRPVDVVFLGSCTNSRISDLRDAARILRHRRVADGVRMLVVPGSSRVRAQAEAEGLDAVFLEAGAEWRLPGCSMCIAMNGDGLRPGELCVSTSNRNFEGRQGRGGRTVLASPLTAAATAVAGAIADPREYLS